MWLSIKLLAKKHNKREKYILKYSEMFFNSIVKRFKMPNDLRLKPSDVLNVEEEEEE